MNLESYAAPILSGAILLLLGAGLRYVTETRRLVLALTERVRDLEIRIQLLWPGREIMEVLKHPTEIRLDKLLTWLQEDIITHEEAQELKQALVKQISSLPLDKQIAVHLTLSAVEYKLYRFNSQEVKKKKSWTFLAWLRR